VYELVTGQPMERLNLTEVRGLDGFRQATLELHVAPKGPLGAAALQAGITGPLPLKIGIVNGLGEAKKVAKAVQDGSLDIDFVEIMACPGGARTLVSSARTLAASRNHGLSAMCMCRVHCGRRQREGVPGEATRAPAGTVLCGRAPHDPPQPREPCRGAALQTVPR
jgi:Iron only hydrogenase large subunit, C-terminal domain